MHITKLATAGLFLMGLTACGKTSFSSDSSSSKVQATSVTTVEDVRRQIVQEEESDDATPPTYAQAQCAWAKAMKPFFTAVADGASLISLRGNMLYRGSHVTEVRDVRGNFIFIGEGDDAKIDKLSDTRGKHNICNVDVGVLNLNSVGNVIIVGGSLGAVEDFNGNLVVDGQIGSIKNSHGNIVGGP